MAQVGTSTSERTGLRKKILSGSIWTVVGFGSHKAMQLFSNLILTRLLFPEAFGLMAIVNVFISGMYMLSDMGIKPAIIQMNKSGDMNFLNTAWTIQIIRGFVLFALMCLLAYPASLLYDDPRLLPLLIFTGVTTIISGFKSIGTHLADRALMVKRSIVLKLVGQGVSVIIMISLALTINTAWAIGVDPVWALAIGTVMGVVAEVITGYIILPGHKHQLRFDKPSALELFHFGKWIFWATLFTYFGGHGIRSIEGIFVDIKTLGFITIAATLAWAMVELIQQFQAKVIFPTLAIYHREEPSRFASVLARMRVRIMVLAVPMFATASLLSNIIIDFLYDDRYAMAGPLLALLAINGAISTLPMLYQNALMARGDTRMHFILVMLTTVFRVGGMVAGFYLGGVFGMLIGTGVGSLLVYLFVAVVAKRHGWLAWKSDFVSIVAIMAFAYVSYYLNVANWPVA